MLFGVSPAYFISRFGNDFSPGDICDSLDDLPRLGFGAFQLEVFHPERLQEWEEQGAREVARAAKTTGLETSQFVGHFLLHSFADGESLASDAGIEEFRRVVGSLEHFPGCRTVTLPIPGIEVGATSYASLYGDTLRKLEKILTVAAANEVRLALEILPYSVIGGSEGFLRLLDHLESPWLGYNFDTGHAWAMKERIELLPEKLSGRVFGTHLCDNDGGVNNSWTPGDGTIDWAAVVGALVSSGYKSSLDIEIHCPADQVEEYYRRGREYLASIATQQE
jgi:sugar phosphate isomerase/epimerase